MSHDSCPNFILQNIFNELSKIVNEVALDKGYRDRYLLYKAPKIAPVGRNKNDVKLLSCVYVHKGNVKYYIF